MEPARVGQNEKEDEKRRREGRGGGGKGKGNYILSSLEFFHTPVTSPISVANMQAIIAPE
jgi:hypothetical protein